MISPVTEYTNRLTVKENQHNLHCLRSINNTVVMTIIFDSTFDYLALTKFSNS